MKMTKKYTIVNSVNALRPGDIIYKGTWLDVETTSLSLCHHLIVSIDHQQITTLFIGNGNIFFKSRHNKIETYPVEPIMRQFYVLCQE